MGKAIVSKPRRVLLYSSAGGRERHKVDYIVAGEDCYGEAVYRSLVKAKAEAIDLAKKSGEDVYIQKCIDEEPADFSSHSQWKVTPAGEITELS